MTKLQIIPENQAFSHDYLVHLTTYEIKIIILANNKRKDAKHKEKLCDSAS